MRAAVLLRGVNVGGNNKVAMPTLRDALTAAGYDAVTTYLQSGNVVVDAGRRRAASVQRDVEEVIAETFGLAIRAVVRTGTELAAIVAASPVQQPADGSRYFVTFLDTELEPVRYAGLKRDEGEQLWPAGRDLYVLLPDGAGRSPLAAELVKLKGVVSTTRNWNTVLKLEALTTGAR